MVWVAFLNNLCYSKNNLRGYYWHMHPMLHTGAYLVGKRAAISLTLFYVNETSKRKRA